MAVYIVFIKFKRNLHSHYNHGVIQTKVDKTDDII